jgi:hypothetical protein
MYLVLLGIYLHTSQPVCALEATEILLAHHDLIKFPDPRLTTSLFSQPKPRPCWFQSRSHLSSNDRALCVLQEPDYLHLQAFRKLCSKLKEEAETAETEEERQ